MKQNQFGRSMIEMLGVLAIIGVLSVAGIAGYSKAMRMHRSNIQKELLVQVFAHAINMRSELFYLQKEASKNVTYLFDDLGLVPDGITYKNNILFDNDNNYLTANYGIVSWSTEDGSTFSRVEYIIVVALQHNSDMLSPGAEDFCQNAIQVAQQNANDIEKITLYQNDNSTTTGHGFRQDQLRTLTLSETKDFCDSCKSSGYCQLFIYINP